jgi:hypothetical protein
MSVQHQRNIRLLLTPCTKYPRRRRRRRRAREGERERERGRETDLNVQDLVETSAAKTQQELH